MIMSSDEHLDTALAEYNEKVARLEDEGPVSELLEALINRGSILLMMESTIAALSDFDEAIDLIEDEEEAGNRIDAGLYIRAHEGRGNILFDGDQISMLEDYRKAASRLSELRPGHGYFDVRSIVDMCIGVADDLMNTGKYRDAEPFLMKCLDVLEGRIGDWEDNRRADADSYLGGMYENIGQPDKAIASYTKAIDIDIFLSERNLIDDYRRLVTSLYNRAELRNNAGDHEGYISDFMLAAGFLERTIDMGQSDEKELLVGLCQEIASDLMDRGNVPEAEKYLLKAMKHGMPDIDKAMSELGIRKPQ